MSKRIRIELIKPPIPKPQFLEYGQLPGRPSVLLRLGHDCLVQLQSQRKYRYDALAWHDPDTKAGTCRVDISGAIMALILNIPPDTHRTPFNFGKEGPALHAVVDLSAGTMVGAFRRLHLPFPPSWKEYVIMPRYRPSKTKYLRALLAMADALEAEGY